MSKSRDFVNRFGALLLAGVFLVTSVAFTAVVIWQSSDQTSRDAEQAALQDSINEQQNAFCSMYQTEIAPAETVPESYIPEGDVTELQITDLVEGTGREASAGDCLVVKYHGTLATNGNKFDGNFDEETALQFILGQGGVIAGWDQGLIGIKEGGTRRLVIPSDMAYGEQAMGETIPANSDLVFVVKLVKIKDE